MSGVPAEQDNETTDHGTGTGQRAVWRDMLPHVRDARKRVPPVHQEEQVRASCKALPECVLRGFTTGRVEGKRGKGKGQRGKGKRAKGGIRRRDTETTGRQHKDRQRAKLCLSPSYGDFPIKEDRSPHLWRSDRGNLVADQLPVGRHFYEHCSAAP